MNVAIDAQLAHDVLEPDGRAGDVLTHLTDTIGPRLACIAEVLTDAGVGVSFKDSQARTYSATAHLLRREASGLFEIAAMLMTQAGQLEEMARTAAALVSAKLHEQREQPIQ